MEYVAVFDEGTRQYYTRPANEFDGYDPNDESYMDDYDLLEDEESRGDWRFVNCN